MLRLRKSSFQAKRKQATHKATRCRLHPAAAQAVSTERTARCPAEPPPREPADQAPHAAARVQRGTGVLEDAARLLGTWAWDLNGQKPTGRRQVQVPASVRPRRDRRQGGGSPGGGPDQCWEPSGSTCVGQAVHTWQRAAVRHVPAAQGPVGTQPAGVRRPGRARSLSPAQQPDGDPAPQQGCGEGHRVTSGPGRGWAPRRRRSRGPGVMGCRRAGGSRTASVLQVTREPGPWGSVTGTHRDPRTSDKGNAQVTCCLYQRSSEGRSTLVMQNGLQFKACQVKHEQTSRASNPQAAGQSQRG